MHKNGSLDNIQKYKLIRQLNTFSKIFDRAIKNRLLTYLEENNILIKNQFGFRKNNLGTGDALVYVAEQLYTNMDKTIRLLVYLWIRLFSKAFDSISRSRLLNILYSIGIVGKYFSLF